MAKHGGRGQIPDLWMIYDDLSFIALVFCAVPSFRVVRPESGRPPCQSGAPWALARAKGISHQQSRGAFERHGSAPHGFGRPLPD